MPSLVESITEVQIEDVGGLVLHAHMPHKLERRHTFGCVGKSRDTYKDGAEWKLGRREPGAACDRECMATPLAAPLHPCSDKIVFLGLTMRANWITGSLSPTHPHEQRKNVFFAHVTYFHER